MSKCDCLGLNCSCGFWAREQQILHFILYFDFVTITAWKLILS